MRLQSVQIFPLNWITKVHYKIKMDPFFMIIICDSIINKSI